MKSNPANHALLTLTAVGVKMVAQSAPCVILDLLTPDELSEFRAELIDAEGSIQLTREIIDLHLARELANRRKN